MRSGMDWKAAGKATFGVGLLVAIFAAAVGLARLAETGQWRTLSVIVLCIIGAALWASSYVEHKRGRPQDTRAEAVTLTDHEREVVLKLAEAWDAFSGLPPEHADDAIEFRASIHAAQRIVLARPSRREMNRR